MKQLIRVTIEEVPGICGTPVEEIHHYMEEEWIRPLEKTAFDDEDISRIQLIHDLIENLGVNEESVPIILHLIDQIHALQLKIRDYSGEDSTS